MATKKTNIIAFSVRCPRNDGHTAWAGQEERESRLHGEARLLGVETPFQERLRSGERQRQGMRRRQQIELARLRGPAGEDVHHEPRPSSGCMPEDFGLPAAIRQRRRHVAVILAWDMSRAGF